MDFFEEKRRNERSPVLITASYIFNKIESPCEIRDISSEGIKMRVKSFFVRDDIMKIKLGVQTLTGKVVRVDGNIISVKFEQLTNEQLNSILEIQQVRNF